MSQPQSRVVAKWAPGDTAWVEFRSWHLQMRARLVPKGYGYWTVKWDNGDTEPQKVRERLLEREAPTKREGGGEMLRVLRARADAPKLAAEQLMRYNIGGKTTGRNDVDAHLCCILRALPSRDVTKQEWGTNSKEPGRGPHAPRRAECSTDKSFVPFEVGASELKDEFVFRVVMTLQASSRRFAGRAPPYNRLDTSASLWRSDDRGTINGLRALVELAAAAESEGLSRGEITLWGAVVYRLINRLSTFSRWAAVCYLRKKHGEKWAWKSEYEEKLYGEDRDEAARKIAVSGSSKEGGSLNAGQWALCRGSDARPHDRGGRVHGAAAATVRDQRLRGLRQDRD